MTLVDLAIVSLLLALGGGVLMFVRNLFLLFTGEKK